jgi:hypothetical protein
MYVMSVVSLVMINVSKYSLRAFQFPIAVLNTTRVSSP